MYTINEKEKENNQQIQEKALKRQGGHVFCPKPKNMYIRCQNTQKTKGIKKEKKGLKSEMHTKCLEKV
jgi:hypothetical protein